MSNKEEKRQVIFTRCPVGGGTEVLLQKGWLQSAYDKVGAEIVMLQSLDQKEHVKHLTQEYPLAFRDGGNVPPIWSHSKGVRTKVIGLTAIKQSHAIMIAKDSNIEAPIQLRGKRLSVPKTRGTVVDPMRAMVLRGYDTVLKAYGIGQDEVRFIDIEVGGTTELTKPNEINGYVGYHKEEILALQNGDIDAFFSHRSLVGQIEDRGFGKVLIDISKTELSNINNIYPSIITVHEDFANANRDLVVIYLRELLRVADWVITNQEEALLIGSKGQRGATYENLLNTRSQEAYKSYAPSFNPKLVTLLKDQKEFLLSTKFIENDFDFVEWLDPSFLKDAQEQLLSQKKYSEV